eukprot:CAMPEP_0194129658 /NCGR_PEP_ID=MMETSP0152-20130528/873_1 /TAXON_ID=1049557 /ORGANISM="Thalassiothrix antarctica, Strain L6-D1" /LENGTH=166 /DNA_ID=CAMNT_0038823959 /DNA_START=89 /DNA_END=589 /DNA_ORIENTATION=-
MAGRNDLTCRQKSAEVTEILMSTFADVVTDWIYYTSILAYNGDADLSQYEMPLLAFVTIGALMAVIIVIGLILNICGCISNKTFSRILAAEVMLGDIPQFVLTGLIQNEIKTGGSDISLEAGLNIAASAYNMFLDVMQMCRMEDDTTPEEEGAEEKKDEEIIAQAE